jgi:excisionase family DNA binding protein
MTSPFVPEGIPQGLTVGQVARALNLKDETVKTALKSGALDSWRIAEGRGWRYVRPDALARFAEACGLHVDWEKLL